MFRVGDRVILTDEQELAPHWPEAMEGLIGVIDRIGAFNHVIFDIARNRSWALEDYEIEHFFVGE